MTTYVLLVSVVNAVLLLYLIRKLTSLRRAFATALAMLSDQVATMRAEVSPLATDEDKLLAAEFRRSVEEQFGAAWRHSRGNK